MGIILLIILVDIFIGVLVFTAAHYLQERTGKWYGVGSKGSDLAALIAAWPVFIVITLGEAIYKHFIKSITCTCDNMAHYIVQKIKKGKS